MVNPGPMEDYDVAIVGSSIAGICVALGLIKHGIKVTVYESIKSFKEVGGGIVFAPNARKALNNISPELWEKVTHAISGNLLPEDKDLFFNYRVGCAPPGSKYSNEEIIAPQTCPGGQYTGSRAYLLDWMYKLMPEGVTHFNKKVLHLEELGAHKGVRLTFRDGTEAVHGSVIGADGIHSVVRRHIMGWDNPAGFAHYSGKYIHRGIIPMEEAEAQLGREKCVNSNLYVGPHGHVVTFPVNHGKAIVVAVHHSSKEWPHDEWVVSPEQHGVDTDKYKDWCTTVKTVYQMMKNNDLWALFDTQKHPPSTYYKEHVCMMGDAAHATQPSQGAGAGMAMEDGYILSELVAHAHKIDAPVEAAFRAFDMVRRPRGQLIVETSSEAGRIWALERPGIGDDFDKVASSVNERYHWIWDWPDEQELSLGRKLIEASF